MRIRASEPLGFDGQAQTCLTFLGVPSFPFFPGIRIFPENLQKPRKKRQVLKIMEEESTPGTLTNMNNSTNPKAQSV